MAVLNRISEKTQDYWRYQARQDFLREQRTMERLLTDERREKDQERAAKEQAESELEALRARMRDLGLDPDELSSP